MTQDNPSLQKSETVASDNETSAIDLLNGADVVQAVLGNAYPQMLRFHEMIQREGLVRGLIGPRDVSIIWERHILNSAAVVPFIKQHLNTHHGSGRIADIGSGGGFPGIVIAAMLPDTPITLIEPMERRVEWLELVKSELHLDNATVLRARAEEAFPVALARASHPGHSHKSKNHHKDGQSSMNVVTKSIEPCSLVTCRAVAPLHKLVGWTLPFLEHSGQLVALKGKSAQTEIEKAAKNIQRMHGHHARVVEAPVGEGLESTHVVIVDKQ
ncbi:16S rRNA methyltransferase [Bifidobacterium aquikefiri]|uniref:Ribosomal RNA small subunit methyltransferase G n=1 Tax=Bifidobacterium aquikefiri TaxID=1653207 RepID=A0A261GBC2_9BIFI|nr:16S rRNA methyltransferase [Bifidobacterium aquikefiri]